LRDPREIILPPRAGFQTVLANRDFRLIWFAQVASQLADKFLMFALLILTYSISRASIQGAALFLAYTMPSIFLSPIAGVYADRHNKKTLMVWTNLVRAALVLLIPLSRYLPYFHGVTWHLLVITFLFAAVGQFFAPSEAAAIPSIVGREELMTATSLFTSTVMVTLFVGVPLSTIAVRVLGTESPYWVTVLLFVLAATLVSSVRAELRRPPDGIHPTGDVLYELRQGLAYIAGLPSIRFAVIQLSLTVAVIFSVFVVAPQYMSTVLRLDPTDVYLFLAPAVIGMLGTALFLGQYGRHFRRSRLLLGGLLGAGITLVLIGSLPAPLRHLAPALLVSFPVIFGLIGGVEFGILFIPALTVLQEKTEPELRGRMFGALFTVVNAAVALPIVLAGGLADILGVTTVIVVMGVLLIASGAISAVSIASAGRPPLARAGEL